MRIAAEKKPRIVKGDLRTDLARLAAEAPKDATLVIFHTAVLAYIRSLPEREEICTICKDPLRFLDLERVTTNLPEDSCSCHQGGAERLLPDGREWGSGGVDRPTRRIPRLDL